MLPKEYKSLVVIRRVLLCEDFSGSFKLAVAVAVAVAGSMPSKCSFYQRGAGGAVKQGSSSCE